MARGPLPRVAVWLAAGAALAAALAPCARASGQEAGLAAEARALADAAQKRYGPGYVTRIDDQRHIVYVSALDAEALGRAAGLLGDYADHQRTFLFRFRMPWNITIVLPTVADYRKAAPTAKASGHYQESTRTLQSISLSDVLLHEFTHALHHADQARVGQRHPVWIGEGLASLFQRSRWRDGRFEVLSDPSLMALQDAVRQNKVHPLAGFCAMDQKAFLDDAEICYAEARHIMLYLYRLEKLRPFYETYKADYAGDLTGAGSLAKTLGKPLAEVEADWRAWVLHEEPPWTPAHPPKAHLGVKMQAVEGGVEVLGFLRNSAAERAGRLQIGDVILSVAGQATPLPRDLTAAVQLCRPGETVDIEVIRDGRAMVVKQLLGLMPP